jgi:hypothetical protein
MAKKCAPGMLCLENVSVFFIFIILGLVLYIWNLSNKSQAPVYVMNSTPLNVPPLQSAVLAPLASVSTRNDPFNDPYSPPLKSNGYYFPSDSSDLRGLPALPALKNVPIQLNSCSFNSGYSQIGILTRKNSNDDIILPLFGRLSCGRRDKWQYYTISNTGNLNAKLPVTFNGKNCTSELGCMELNNGDNVYVEGYKDTFVATVYETGAFAYNPYI